MCHPQALCEDFKCRGREKVSCSCGAREEEIICGDIEASANNTREEGMKLEEREAELQPDESEGSKGMPAVEEDLSKTGANRDLRLELSADGLLPCNEECVMESFKGFLRKILMQAEQEETEEEKMEANRRGRNEHVLSLWTFQPSNSAAAIDLRKNFSWEAAKLVQLNSQGMTQEGFVREDYNVKNLLLSGRLSGLGDHVCETFARRLKQEETTIMVLPFLPARARRQIHTLCSSMNLWHATIARHVEPDSDGGRERRVLIGTRSVSDRVHVHGISLRDMMKTVRKDKLQGS